MLSARSARETALSRARSTVTRRAKRSFASYLTVKDPFMKLLCGSQTNV
jgi:hypothetical protein